MKTENLSTLKIHKLTQEQYDRELAAGRIDESALYLTPDNIKPVYEYAQECGYIGTEEQFAEIFSNPSAINEPTLLKLSIKPTTDPATSLHIQDSANYRVLDFGMDGKTEQATTTGAQLFDLASSVCFISQYGKIESEISVDNNTIITTNTHTVDRSGNLDLGMLEVGSYYLSFEVVGEYSKAPALYKGNAIDALVKIANIDMSKGIAFTLDENIHCWIGWVIAPNTPLTLRNLMLNSGTTAKPFEPYTGGMASPNPEYPQPITHAGKFNEETGRYEVDVEVCNKNFFNGELLTSFFADTKGNMSSVAENHEKYRSILMNLPQGTYTVASSERCHFVRFLENDTLTTIGVGNTNSYTFTTIGGVVGVSFRKQDNTIWDDSIIIHVEKGTTATEYIPHQAQHITLTSSRELTKWDRLVKKDGLYQWAFKHYHGYLYGTEDFITDWYPLLVTRKTYPVGIYKKDESALRKTDFYSTYTTNIGFSNTTGRNQIGINIENKGFTSKEEFIAFLQAKTTEGKPWDFWYETEAVEHVPVSEEEQALLESLETYYGVTNITNSEECMMQIQYVADTKSYVDNKIAAIQAAVI